MPSLKKRIAKLDLSPASIDEAGELTTQALMEAGAGHKDVVRCRLSVEEILGIWASILGIDTQCDFACGTRLGNQYIKLSAPGRRCDPHVAMDDLFAGIAGGQTLLSSIGLVAVYEYRDGVNVITLAPPKEKTDNPYARIGIAACLALALGLLSLTLPADWRTTFANSVFTPAFDMLMSLLSTIAGPMIFLAVCSGIYSIGDLTLFGKIGRKLIGRFVLMTYVICTLALVIAIGFFPVSFVSSGAGNAESAFQIYKMILNIVPGDIVTPFQTGNAMQIIFLACACGMGILILGDKVTSLAEITGQLHSVVQLLMRAVSRLTPLFVFTCVLNLFLTDSLSRITGMGKQVLLCVLLMPVFVLGYQLAIKRKFKTPMRKTLLKSLPTFLIALTTASSASAFSTNVETCEKQLGIEGRLVDFGVPLGQVLFMPLSSVVFLISALCMAEIFSVPITPAWLIIAVLVAGILAIAMPPIPGGGLSCYTILFLQLGIPLEGVTLAISIEILLEFIVTACDLTLLQSELVLTSSKLGMLDESILKKP